MLEERHYCVTAAAPEEPWLVCWPGNTKSGLTKQRTKSKSCWKRNASATSVCFQNLLIKLPSCRHTRLPAAHSRLSLDPCRMIGGQHLLIGHNAVLTWVTCAPSMRHTHTGIYTQTRARARTHTRARGHTHINKKETDKRLWARFQFVYLFFYK